MIQLREWGLNHSSTQKSRMARNVIILLFILFSMTFFTASNAWCGFSPGSYDFGWHSSPGTTCTTAVSFTNDFQPYYVTICDSNGCRYCNADYSVCWSQPPDPPTINVSFTAPSGFSVSPSSAVVPAWGTVNLSLCATYASVGDFYGAVTADSGSSVGYYGTEFLHVKMIDKLVTCEPLNSRLDLGSVQVGQAVSKTFNVCNYNSFAVTINSISIDNNNFTVASGVNTVISPVIDQRTPSCSPAEINFIPQTTGNMNGNIQVYTTAQNPTYTCSGIGTATVTPSAGANGNISPSTPQTVTTPITKSFTVTPYTNYHIASVTGCGGTLVGNTYTTGQITGNCTVLATFAINTYTVTPTAGSQGSLNPNMPQSVAYNGTTSFTVTPNTGYYMSVTGCGGQLMGNTYTTGPITGDCTVSATFASNGYIVTPSAGANGGISPNTTQAIALNGTTSFRLTPTSGYSIDSVTGCSGTLAGNIYTTGPITGNCTVSASFASASARGPAFSISGGIFLGAAGLGIILWRRRKANGQTQVESK